VSSLLEKYKIQHHKSSLYGPQTNGIVEATNKNIWRKIEKMDENHEDWPDSYHLRYGGIKPQFSL